METVTSDEAIKDTFYVTKTHHIISHHHPTLEAQASLSEKQHLPSFEIVTNPIHSVLTPFSNLFRFLLEVEVLEINNACWMDPTSRGGSHIRRSRRKIG